MHTTKKSETTFQYNGSGLPEGDIIISNSEGELRIDAADLRAFIADCIIKEKISNLEQIDDLEDLL